MHPRRELLTVLYTADGPRALTVAAEDTGSLQLTGDGLLLALQQNVEAPKTGHDLSPPNSASAIGLVTWSSPANSTATRTPRF